MLLQNDWVTIAKCEVWRWWGRCMNKRYPSSSQSPLYFRVILENHFPPSCRCILHGFLLHLLLLSLQNCCWEFQLMAEHSNVTAYTVIKYIIQLMMWTHRQWLLFVCMNVNYLSPWVIFKYFCFLIYSVILAVQLKNMGININISRARRVGEGAIR